MLYKCHVAFSFCLMISYFIMHKTGSVLAQNSHRNIYSLHHFQIEPHVYTQQTQVIWKPY